MQQISEQQTKTLVRIESKVDGIDSRIGGIQDSLQRYATLEHLEKNYVRKETHEFLAEKVKVVDEIQKRIQPIDNIQEKLRAIIWGLGVIFVSLVGLILNTIFKFFGGH